MTRRVRLAAVLASLSAFLTATQAADWPAFRGPTGTGVSNETDFPIQWAKENYLWKVKLPGPGAASPITSGDKVFVVCYTGYHTKVLAKDVDKSSGRKNFGDQSKLRRTVVCLGARSGNVLWQREVEAKLPEQPVTEMIGEHGYATNTPVTDGQNVYVFFGKTGVMAFDFAGNKLWHTDVGSGTYMYGTAASLALYKNLVIVNAHVEGKAMIAIDKTNGQEVWRNKEIGATWATPILVKTAAGADELVLSQPGKVIGYDPETGKELWRCQGLPNPEIGGIYNTPVAKDSIVYAVGGGAPGQQAIGVAVRAGGRGDVNKTHVLWRIKAGSTVNSPVVNGDYLYYIDIGFVNCIRADTGKVVYKERLYETPREYPSPVVVGDKIFMLTRFDGLFVIGAHGKHEVLAHNSFPDDDSVFNASPAFGNGRIYIRSNAYLYCIGKK
jgi:hypothetical protein